MVVIQQFLILDLIFDGVPDFFHHVAAYQMTKMMRLTILSNINKLFILLERINKIKVTTFFVCIQNKEYLHLFAHVMFNYIICLCINIIQQLIYEKSDLSNIYYISTCPKS